jgi:hypothetical protein
LIDAYWPYCIPMLLKHLPFRGLRIGAEVDREGRNLPSEEMSPGVCRIDLLMGVILSKLEQRSYRSLLRIDHIYSFGVNL